LSIGTINIPSQTTTRSVLRILPTNYREFDGQIIECSGELEITVSSRNPSNARYVHGSSAIFLEMIEYLALHMALDLNPELIENSDLDVTPSDRVLALAMGTDEFRQQRYERALAFLEQADRCAPLDKQVGAMLGLTHYHLSLAQPNETSFTSAPPCRLWRPRCARTRAATKNTISVSKRGHYTGRRYAGLPDTCRQRTAKSYS
jgi:hypothetical protein